MRFYCFSSPPLTLVTLAGLGINIFLTVYFFRWVRFISAQSLKSIVKGKYKPKNINISKIKKPLVKLCRLEGFFWRLYGN